VCPDEQTPVKGHVTQEASSVNESKLTGEHTPVEKGTWRA